MPRIFLPLGLIAEGRVSLPEAEARRLSRVLRLRPGDLVTLFDGVKEYHSHIIEVGPKHALVEIIGESGRVYRPTVTTILGQGMPKGEKLEWALQKAVELGVSSVVPVLMERSVKRPDISGFEKKLVRLRRIATEAAQQSGRLDVPDVPCFMDLPMFLEYTNKASIKLLLYEGERTRGLKDVLRAAGPVESVALLVGPEGGLAVGEVEEAEAAGYLPVGLGPRILRTETAGIAALAIIQYEMGDVG